MTHQPARDRIRGALQRYSQRFLRPCSQIVKRNFRRRCYRSAEGQGPASSGYGWCREMLANEKQIVRSCRLVKQRQIETADFRFLCPESWRCRRDEEEPPSQTG